MGCVVCRCGYEGAPLQGTFLQSSKTRLVTWVRAAWVVVNAGSKGISQSALAGEFQGLSPKEARTILTVFRQAMAKVNAAAVLVNPRRVTTQVQVSDVETVPIEFLIEIKGRKVGRVQVSDSEAPVVKGEGEPIKLFRGHEADLLRQRLHSRLMASHRGPIPKDQLHGFLEEFVFFTNRRDLRQKGRIFHELLQAVVQVPPAKQPRRKTN